MILCLVLLANCDWRADNLPSLSLRRDSPAPVEHAPLRETQRLIPSSSVITVQANETLYQLASRYQITPQSIIRDNDLQSPYQLSAGMTLQLTPPRYHDVQPEDNLYSLSQRYAVSQYQLAKTNGLAQPYRLIAGQRLILPDTLDFSVLDLDIATETITAPSTSVFAAPAPSGRPAPSLDVVPITRPSANIPSPQKKPKAKPQKQLVVPNVKDSGFAWPVRGDVISEFGPIARGIHNDGINIKAKRGTDVRASAAGVVAYIGTNLKNFGSLILIKHKGGYITAYAHLDRITVSEGDIVKKGVIIGQVGTSGRVQSPQLHFEIRKSRTPVNPRDLITHA